MFRVVPSEKVPVATSCVFAPARTEGMGGVIAMDTSDAVVTVTVAVPDEPMYCAVIVAPPGVNAESRPLLPAASLTDAVEFAEDVQVARAVTLRVLPSVYTAVAVSCS